MIPVSQDFKNAIKSRERQIKGYVEVLYDLPDVEVTPSVFEESGICQLASTYTDISEIVNNKRVTYNYGTLDYLPLDGTYLTMSDGINENAGYITDNVANSIEAYYDKFILTFDETTINGITIYFKNNTPHYGTITFSDGTTKQIMETSNIYTLQVILDEPKTITGMTIQFGGWEWWQYQNRKIRIDEIDLGITQVYKDNELIEFTIDEEVNKLVEETPTNEAVITLNNMNDIFNPLNPKGIVPYLTENVIIKPYIGVLTENHGIEYVKMGEFYFDSYTNNKNKTTTLIGKNLFSKLEQEQLKNDNASDILLSFLHKTDFEQFLQNYSYNYNVEHWANLITDFTGLKDTMLMGLLRRKAFQHCDRFYINRDNTITFKEIDTTAKDNLSKQELLEDAQFKKINRINVAEYSREVYQVTTHSEAQNVFETTHKLQQASETILLTSSNPIYFNGTYTQSGGTSITKVGASGRYLAFVTITGSVGSEVTINLYSTETYEPRQDTLTQTNIQNNEPETKIQYELPFFLNQTNPTFLTITPSYEMEFDYNGDPSLEAGDYINVETPYGYKPLFIQKNYFKFDGGLEGHIEGVE